MESKHFWRKAITAKSEFLLSALYVVGLLPTHVKTCISETSDETANPSLGIEHTIDTMRDAQENRDLIILHARHPG